MMARVHPKTGRVFHLWWEKGRVLSDIRTGPPKEAADYLNGEIELPRSRPNEGGTDSHWYERGRLQSEDDFLLTVGSLVDVFEAIEAVELIGARN